LIGAAGGYLWENDVLEGEEVIQADLAKSHTGRKQNGRYPCKSCSTHVNLA
jgi:hypothetical protein